MTLTLLFWLFTKHFIVDFPLQATPWMYRNKGTFLHPGGLAHAALHGLGTYVVVTSLGLPVDLAQALALMDTVLHYWIDYFKVNITQFFELTPINSEWFWVLLGVDQYLHACTYFLMALALGDKL